MRNIFNIDCDYIIISESIVICSECGQLAESVGSLLVAVLILILINYAVIAGGKSEVTCNAVFKSILIFNIGTSYTGSV